MADNPDDGGEDIDRAVDHLHTYLEGRLPDLTAEHLLGDLGRVREKLDECQSDDEDPSVDEG